jgi:Reverse transcriptase (RNA-dependent DNA polymerase)
LDEILNILLKYYEILLEDEVLLASKKMKNGKASGPDNIKNEHVKMLIEFLLPEVTKFFNLCLKQGIYPEGWRYSHLKLLFKGKGDLEDKNSYRGISVGSVLYNLLDRILHNRIYASLIEYIPKNQYGFVRGRNTLQAVKKLVGEINSAVYMSKVNPYTHCFWMSKKHLIVWIGHLFSRR